MVLNGCPHLACWLMFVMEVLRDAFMRSPGTSVSAGGVDVFGHRLAGGGVSLLPRIDAGRDGHGSAAVWSSRLSAHKKWAAFATLLA